MNYATIEAFWILISTFELIFSLPSAIFDGIDIENPIILLYLLFFSTVNR